MPDLSGLAEWIESHQTTVDFLKWLVLLVVAWAAGIFRCLRNLTRNPRVAVSEVISRCLILEAPYEGHQDATKAVFLLNIEVENRSSERIVVSSFELRYRRQVPLFRWSQKFSAISLPNRVHHKMGGGTKIMRNWFAHFPDGIPTLTVEGKIDARDAESGYALFVTHTHGSWNPKVQNNLVRVRVYERLTTGRTVSASAMVVVAQNPEFFEQMVPGILDQVEHPSAWNVPARFRTLPNSHLGPTWQSGAPLAKNRAREAPLCHAFHGIMPRSL